MSGHYPPRHFILSAPEFDGVTDVPINWTSTTGRTSTSANEPILHQTVEVPVGRFTFPSLLRSGSNAAVIFVRSLFDPEATDVAEQRSVKTSDFPTDKQDTPAAATQDALLRTVGLSKEWVGPFRFNPTDALSIVHLLPEGGPASTIEVQVWDVGDLADPWIDASLVCCTANGDNTGIAIFQINEEVGGPLPTPTAAKNYYVFEDSSGAFTLPSSGTATTEQELFFINRTQANLVRLDPAVGDDVNGWGVAHWADLRQGQALVMQKFSAGRWWGSWEDGDPITESTMAFPAAVAAWRGRLVRTVEFIADGDITLPDPATVAVGDSVTFVRINTAGGDGVPRIVTNAGTDEVNGRTGIADTAYWLRKDGDAVTYYRGAGGWIRASGQGANETVVSAANILAAQLIGREGTQYAIATAATTGSSVQLPKLADVGVGFRVVILNPTDFEHVVVRSAADTLNSVASALGHPPRSVVICEATETTWMVVGGDPSPVPVTTAVNVVLPVWTGTLYVTMTGGPGQTLQLPPVATVAPNGGARLWVNNTSANAASIIPTGADTFNGGAASVTSPPGRRTLVESDGVQFYTLP